MSPVTEEYVPKFITHISLEYSPRQSGASDFYHTHKLLKGMLTSLSVSRIHLPAKYLKCMNIKCSEEDVTLLIDR